jgi:protein SCO1
MMREHSNWRRLALLVMCAALVSSALAEPSSLYANRWLWTEDSGARVSLSLWKGDTVFLTMAYSSCRSTCTLAMHELSLIQQRLDSLGRAAQFVIVSYDPRNDTPAAWSAYRKQRHLQRPNWHFLTGDVDSTRQLAATVGLSGYWKADRHIVHDFRIVILAADGRIARTLEWEDLPLKDIP